MKNFELSPKEVQELKAAHRRMSEKYAADRVKAIVLLGTDWTLEEVSEALLLDSETLRNYVSLYKTGGVKKLIERHYKGSFSKLNDKELKELKAHLMEMTYLTVAEIISYVKKTYRKKYAVSGMTTLLHRLGFVHKKPSMSPCKVDAVKQLEFLQKYEKIRRSGRPIYSLDGCHPQHNSMPQYGWILKGETKLLPSNSGRKRVNIQGAVNLIEHSLISTVHETLDKYSTIEILKKIEAHHSHDRKIYVIVDNAGYYKADEVKQYLKKSKIELVYLPPYAPHLSLIERVWRYFKKTVLYNRYYPTFKEFTEHIEIFLKKSHRKVFKNLLAEKFHFVNPNASMLQLAA
jgi:transposase